ncbi:Inositolphosphorylceramide synthase subunit Kei1-domain-containing protein [Blakeslea trispora]|nr:Inositolphosphorylceramide synthase subunit Kei1-domain-containing protein [Blakeslea trispora]
MPSSKGRHCCGFVPLKTGVSLITIFGILNKLSGFYGILSFDFSDTTATAIYIYSLFAIAVFVYGLYGQYHDNVRITRWYTMFFLLDCLVSVVSTIWFAVNWFVYTDHSLPELTDNPEKLAEHDRVFEMESKVSIAVLVILRFVHFYFAYVVIRYYKLINRAHYSKLPTQETIDLEDTSNRSSEPSPKPAQD